jgi:hypothetical protein
MDAKDIRKEFKRVTRRSFFKPERPVQEELDVATQTARITRRQCASRVIAGETADGRTYVLYKRRNPALA